MYTEEKRNSFPFKDFALKFLFLALLIFLLLWLFPMPNSKVTNSVKPLIDAVFKENINSMKDASKTYYTNDRLPKNIGDKVSMSLQEMLDKKLLIPFIDSKGKSCDTKKSYVEITKMEKEYILKVYLSCGNQEDYVIEYMGCYDKCITCDDKVVIDVPKPTPKPTPVKPKPVPVPTKTITEYEFSKTSYKDETLVMGKKWVAVPVYNYEFTRTIYGTWSTWSSWSTTAIAGNDLTEVQTRTSSKTEQVFDHNEPVYQSQITSYNYGSWYYSTTKYSTSALTPYTNDTEKMTYEGIEARKTCDTCYTVTNYYKYNVYKRTKTAVYSNVLVGQKAVYVDKTTYYTEYSYRTRSFVSKTETTWSAAKTLSGWTATGKTKQVADNGYYVYSDWAKELPTGYTLHNTKTTKVVTGVSYTWSTNDNLSDGWQLTGKTKTKEVTM
jgi:hypothetical protein